MSDSPKYSSARLSAAREQSLRDELARAAQREQQRRAAAEEALRRQRLENARTATSKDAAKVQSEITSFAGTEQVRHVPQDRLAELQRRATDAARVGAGATGEGGIRQASQELNRVRQELSQLAAAGESARLRASLASQADLFNQLKQQVGALNARLSTKFDAGGQREVRTLLDKAEELLRKKNETEVKQVLGSAHERLEHHRLEVANAFARWLAEKENTEALLGATEDRLAGLRADGMVMRWQAAHLAAIDQHVSKCRGLFAAEKFAETEKETAAVQQEIDRVVQQSGEIQLKEDRRQYIVAGIVSVLRQMNFVIQAGSPTLEHSGFPTSAAVIQARRLNGESLAVSVPQEGEIHYAIHGFPLRTQRDDQGRIVRTCDAAEDEITAMHTRLKELCEIEMTELHWDGKPDRIARTTLDETLPSPDQRHHRETQ